MEPVSGVAARPLSTLAAQLAGIHTSLPAVENLQAVLRPPPIPIVFRPVSTPLVRGGTTFAYLVTAGGQQAPTSASVTLGAGTLWFDASMLGAAFASGTGLVGVPFASATLKTTGTVTFGAAGITLDPAATLALTVASRTSPVTAPAGDAIGKDFQSAKLTPFAGATITFAPGTGAGSATIAPTGQATALVYGQTVTLAPKPGAAVTALDLPAPFAAIACTPAPGTFAAASSASSEFAVSGSGPLLSGGVLFPVVELGSATPSTLPEPAEAWSAALGVGPGLRAQLGNVAAPVRLAGAVLALTPARLVGLVALQGRVTQRYDLWTTHPPALLPLHAVAVPDLPRPQPLVTLDLPPGTAVGFSATPTAETVLAACTIDAVVDQPVAADGSRIALHGPALELRTLTATGIAIDIGSPLTPKAVTSMALDTPNALIPVGTPNGFLVVGTLASGTISGKAEVVFPAAVVIPTLPHPYAASYLASPRTEEIAGVAARVAWSAVAPVSPPALSIELIRASALTGAFAGAAAGAAAQGAGAAPVPPVAVPAAPPPAPPAPALVTEALVTASRSDTGGLVGFALLDVSSAGSQWGIAVLDGGIPQLAFSGLELEAPSADTLVFTVPGISWEPVVDGNAAIPSWFAAFAPNDGTPTTFLVSTGSPVPLVPLPALKAYQAAAGTHPTTATFTLPFGITAHLVDGPTAPGGPAAGSGHPTYQTPAVSFPQAGPAGADLTGAAVLSVRATGPDPLGLVLPGSATVGTFDPATPSNDSYGALVMGATPPTLAPADFWNQGFQGAKQGGIPVARIDLSGYGTTMFSDWRESDPSYVGVVRANFEVHQGRTAHELVEFQTWILPWCIRMQRSVVFDRSDGGEVVRHDSGWQPVDVGKFILLEPPVTNPALVMAGPVVQLQNVRNIVIAGADVVVDGIAFAPLTFDADVVFDPKVFVAAFGKNPAPSVPATGIQGWADATVGAAPTGQQIVDLLKQVSRAAGRTSGIARVGGTGESQFTMNLASFAAGVTSGAKNLVQVALFGTPRLPKDGQWSVAKRASTANAPSAVPQATPVPLTKAVAPASLPTGPGTWADGWRLLDPEDAQSPDAPATFYSLLQGTGTAKTLYEHPLIGDAGQAMGFGNKPSLADIGSLLGVGGLFPNLGSILQIPDLSSVPLQADGFTKTYTWTITEADRTLLDLGIVHLVLSYKGPNGDPTQARIDLDATPGAPNWHIYINSVSVQAIVDGFGSDPLLTVQGGFQAGSDIKAGFVGPSATPTAPPGPANLPGQLGVLYGSALSAIKDIFSGLSDLAKDLGGDAQLDVGFTGSQLSVLQSFTLPTIPLGFGDISDLGIDLGFTATIPTDAAFHVGIGSKTEPFQWTVDPLAGTGAIVLGVDHGAIDVYIEAGLGLGLAIDVGIASGSASIVVSMSLEIANSAITLGLMLTGKAEVDVLGGLASASLTLSAALQITLKPLPSPTEADLAGQVAVGIHISICWVINIDFDGSWGFSTTVSV